MSTAISVLGGVGLFLLGMSVMTAGLKGLAGSRLRTVLSKAAATPLSGAFWGAVVTLIVQSSSATTMTTIGLVSAGVLTFQQGLALVFGANVGTTGTGWLVALIGVRVSLTAAALPMIFIGALVKLLGRGRLSGAGRIRACAFRANDSSARDGRASRTIAPSRSACRACGIWRRVVREHVWDPNAGRRWAGNDGPNAIFDCGHRVDDVRSLRWRCWAGSSVRANHRAEYWNGDQLCDGGARREHHGQKVGPCVRFFQADRRRNRAHAFSCRHSSSYSCLEHSRRSDATRRLPYGIQRHRRLCVAAGDR